MHLRETERKKHSVTSKSDEERCRKGIRPEGKSKQDLVSCMYQGRRFQKPSCTITKDFAFNNMH